MSKANFSLGVALGALVGAATAYFLAPQSGKELQNELKVKAQETKEKAIVRLDEAIVETEMWLDEKRSEDDNSVNEPIRYEQKAENVAPAPDYTEAPDVFIEE